VGHGRFPGVDHNHWSVFGEDESSDCVTENKLSPLHGRNTTHELHDYEYATRMTPNRCGK